MCGLVAILSPALPIREDLLERMRDRLAHRGPDNGSHWIRPRERVALAHRRLSIIDTSHAADQPMATPDGQQRIVFNGEIYNYIELRAELEQAGLRFRTRSDTEVLLAALVHWGDGALERLNGMFAFALWDERTRRLLVARDRFGEKPLFMAHGAHGTKLFASEMKALLMHPLVRCGIDPRALARYGTGGWYEDDALTFFEGIERLAPAHASWYHADGRLDRRWRYWTPDYNAIQRDITPRDAVEGFAQRLHRSVILRLRADVPVGSSLSGGLDSSLVVGMLARERELTSFSQNTFSACFPSDPTMSEEKEVEAVVRHSGARSFVVAPDPKRLMEESALLHWHQEEPFLSASIYLQWCVARLARQQDTTVLLDGQGADELLGGYQYYFRQRQLDMLDLGQPGKALRETNKFTRRLERASAQYEGAQRRFNAAVAYTAAEVLAMRHSRPQPSFPAYEVGVAPGIAGGRLRRTLSEALQYNSLPMLLRYADRNSMAFSREARLPYLDHDLVDFCIRLPDEFLIRHGWQKWVQRMAAGNTIPSAIRWRADKVGYAAPLDNWLRAELKEWGLARTMDSSLTDMPGYSRDDIEHLWKEHLAGTANHSWALWRWISLSEWLSLHRAGWWRAGPSIRASRLEAPAAAGSAT